MIGLSSYTFWGGSGGQAQSLPSTPHSGRRVCCLCAVLGISSAESKGRVQSDTVHTSGWVTVYCGEIMGLISGQRLWQCC